MKTKSTLEATLCFQTVLATILLTFAVGCKTQTKDISGLDSWLRVQKEYAKTLNSYVGTSNRYMVVPIHTSIYPIGTILNGTSPVEELCGLKPINIRTNDVEPLPNLGNTANFTFGAGLPDNWKRAIKLASAKAGVTNDSTFTLAYSNLKENIIYERQLEDLISAPTCTFSKLMALDPKPYLIVRGWIVADMSVKSTNKFDGGAEVSTTNSGELKIAYAKGKGFSIDDTSVKARFAIVSALSPFLQVRTIKGSTNLLTDLGLPAFSDAANVQIWAANNHVTISTKDGAELSDANEIAEMIIQRPGSIHRVAYQTYVPKVVNPDPNFVARQFDPVARSFWFESIANLELQERARKAEASAEHPFKRPRLPDGRPPDAE